MLRILVLSEKAAKAKDSHGRTPLHLLSLAGESEEVLRIILDECPSAAQVRDDNGYIPLHSAIEGYAKNIYPDCIEESLYEETVQCLLEAYALGVHVEDNEGMTPLMLACEFGLSVGIIYRLVKTDPISSNLAWSQVSREYRKVQSSNVKKKRVSSVRHFLFGR
jgi:ankyrin repeat protein